ncbi:MAG: hypothetical protein K2H33_07995 [Muribaculaceae bacterium]|nr:hypothetical protein [Muribaculaceae bacterium]MDE6119723.1 hypothetical protein [Muribaculaceae bacterium]MDE6315755.1 hypothetical protein [Muribaculaceae bacterium]
MNNVTLHSSAPESSRLAVSGFTAAVLSVVLIICTACAFVFGFIIHCGLGFYSSLGIGALTIDPLRTWLSHDDNSRRV